MFVLAFFRCKGVSSVKKVVGGLFLIVIILFGQMVVVYAHPGRTDPNGCHKCRSNCESWGLSYGEYHCHNGGGSSYNTTTRRTTTRRQVYGCMDKSAINYNYSATVSDGSCKFEKTEVKTEVINYETKAYGGITSGTKKVIKEGQNGEKEVTIKKVVDESGNEISSEVIKENVIKEPVNEVIKYENKTTKKEDITNKEESDNTPLIITIILLIVNVFYGNKNKNANLIINKIKLTNLWIRYILYFLYFIFVIPVFIDVVLVIIDLFKKNNRN